METIKLRNGSTVAEPLLAVVINAIKSLQEELDAGGMNAMGIHLALYDLQQKARNDEYRITTSYSIQRLSELSLINGESQQMNNDVRAIVLSCIEGGSGDLNFVNPIVK